MNDALTISLHLAETTEDGKQWVHLLPAGVFTGIDGRGPYDATDAEGIILRSRERAGERKIVVDYNQGTELRAPKGEPSPAAGWIVGMQARQDGVYGLVEWTPTAAEEIAGQQYRYLSPVMAHGADGRIHSIKSVALVNRPNLDQLTSLFSEQESPVNDTQIVVALRQLLNLKADADGAAILAAITSLHASAHAEATPDPTKFVPIGDYQRAVKELAQLNQGLSRHAAEERVDGEIRNRRLFPFMRDWAVTLFMADEPGFDSFVEGLGAPAARRLLTGSHTSALPPSMHSEGRRADALTTEIAANMGFDPKQFADFRAKTSNQD